MDLTSRFFLQATPTLSSTYHPTFDMTSELRAYIKMVGEPYLLELERFATPVLGYPAELCIPKDPLAENPDPSKTSNLVLPITVATDGRITCRFTRDSWARLEGVD